MIPENALAQIRLLIFDLDGTLVDSEIDLALSVNAVRKEMGLEPLPVHQVASYVGQGVTVLIRRALGEAATDETVKNVTNRFLKYYGDHMLDNTVPYPGVREALEALGSTPMAVLTNKPVVFSQRMLAGLGLARHFAFIYGGNSFEQKKPDPVGVYKLMNDMKASAKATMIVGDSDTDVLTGQNAGVWTCGVTYGIGSLSLEATPPDLLLADLRELPPLLNGRIRSQEPGAGNQKTEG
jgi:phosphoglycolate phosphatase